MAGRVSNQEKGDAFENYIASLYAAMGFRVQRNIRLKGQQLDILLLSVLPGVGELRILVECKYLESGTVPNSAVNEFAAFFASSKDLYGFTNAVIVTNRDFSLSAKDAAGPEKLIALKTQTALERELLNVSTALQFAIQRYESTPIFTEFVSPVATGRMPNSYIVETEYALMGRLSSFGRSGSGCLVIFGDVGSGKTTLLQRLHYEIGRDYLLSHNARVPILVRLRGRRDHAKLDDFLRQTLADELERPIPIGVFWDRLQAGQFVLLLDGFDEMSTQSTAEDRIKLLDELYPLLVSKSPSILTCRPTYFVTAQEYNTMLSQLGVLPTVQGAGFHRRIPATHPAVAKYTGARLSRRVPDDAFGQMTLQLWDTEKIQEYLRLRLGPLSLLAWSKMQKVYDITDLMSRPLLASMVVDTILELPESDRLERLDSFYTGTAELYETYTGVQLHRETIGRGTKQALTYEQRRFFCQALAVALLRSGSLAINYHSIFEIVRSRQGIEVSATKIDSSADPEAIATDVLVCSFLQRNPDDTFSFTHKSFMEFFVAQNIRDSVYSEAIPSLMSSPVPRETIKFLGSYVLFDSHFARKIIDCHRMARADEHYRGPANLTNNLVSVLLLFGDGAKYLGFRGAEVVELKFVGLSWYGHDLSRLLFKRCLIERCVLQDVRLRAVSLVECEVSGVTLRGGRLQCLSEQTTFDRMSVGDSIVDMRCRAARYAEVVVTSSKWRVSGTSEFRRCKFVGCDVTFRDARGLLAELKRCRFTDSVLEVGCVQRTGGRANAGAECEFERCLLLGVSVDESVLAEAARLESSRGLIVLSTPVFVGPGDRAPYIRLTDGLLAVRAAAEKHDLDRLEKHLVERPLILGTARESRRFERFVRRFFEWSESGAEMARAVLPAPRRQRAH